MNIKNLKVHNKFISILKDTDILIVFYKLFIFTNAINYFFGGLRRL